MFLILILLLLLFIQQKPCQKRKALIIKQTFHIEVSEIGHFRMKTNIFLLNHSLKSILFLEKVLNRAVYIDR